MHAAAFRRARVAALPRCGVVGVCLCGVAACLPFGVWSVVAVSRCLGASGARMGQAGCSGRSRPCGRAGRAGSAGRACVGVGCGRPLWACMLGARSGAAIAGPSVWACVLGLSLWGLWCWSSCWASCWGLCAGPSCWAFVLGLCSGPVIRALVLGHRVWAAILGHCAGSAMRCVVGVWVWVREFAPPCWCARGWGGVGGVGGGCAFARACLLLGVNRNPTQLTGVRSPLGEGGGRGPCNRLSGGFPFSRPTSAELCMLMGGWCVSACVVDRVLTASCVR